MRIFPRQAWVWIVVSAFVLLLPLALHSDFALSVCTKIGIAVVFATLGLGCLVLFLLGRDEPSYLIYSLTCLLLSIYLICRSSMRSFLWDAPSWWYYVEIGSLGLVGAGMSALVSRILGEGPLRVLFWLWRIFAGCGINEPASRPKVASSVLTSSNETD